MTATVPVIDLQTASAEDLVNALIAASCVFVVGHGIPTAEREAVVRTGDQFFALPRDEKQKVIWPGDGPWYGWQPVNESGPKADLHERFEVRLAAGQSQLDDAAWATSFPLWPQHPPGFSQAWTRLYASMHSLSSRLTRMIAQGLKLPESDLPAWTLRQHSNLVLNHFHAQTGAPPSGRLRAHAHTDIGGITLLWADDAPGGLEAAIGPEQAWVPVRLRDDAYLLQAGDLVHLWSGGRIPANLHRVVNPPPQATPQARRSLVFFHHPNPETWVAPTDGAAQSGISAAEHILARQRTDYAMTESR
ncbi:2-oxoglutarate and iron-dependent oxygenase domain-containing protein [Algiphilus sp. W345]|uniref:2-oxoglutarate-dependent ethylene/succinate-forming enzyme n=1 Tax=Banduia mediterranea TaxID=3075609 RepID=A0ABU2WJS6_9GAMM|nr:2OG-Fe(II) oxygenase family protein [Algiphilus sp. W345]MDT0498122.1 2-oxoglutarate and iron-dependent oxygenase domain-containing protein [Algiphilus sp. W345]